MKIISKCNQALGVIIIDFIKKKYSNINKCEVVKNILCKILIT